MASLFCATGSCHILQMKRINTLLLMDILTLNIGFNVAVSTQTALRGCGHLDDTT